MPFEFRYRVSGGAPTIQQVNAGTAGLTLKKGDMLLRDTSGEIQLGVSGSINFLGVCLADYSGLTQTTSKVDVITDFDAVYAVVDGTARIMGATLDLGGTGSGVHGVTASSNKDFVVVATKGAATDRTLVRFNIDTHLFSSIL